jgi:hypothetical protein
MFDEFLSLAKSASERDILMSRKHCHARNVSSIVLKNDGGRLLRAFLAWPGHRLGNNSPSGSLEVGIHDHKYDLTLSLIAGKVENVIYKQSSDGEYLLQRWRFQSGVASGTPYAEATTMERLEEVARFTLAHGEQNHMGANVLHDIECHETCGWLVQEGETRKSETTLYTSTSVAAIETRGLYESFACKADVLSHVAEWASLVQ